MCFEERTTMRVRAWWCTANEVGHLRDHTSASLTAHINGVVQQPMAVGRGLPRTYVLGRLPLFVENRCTNLVLQSMS
jgi:hypothetical protein